MASFPFFHLQHICVFKSKVSILQTAYSCILFKILSTICLLNRDFNPLTCNVITSEEGIVAIQSLSYVQLFCNPNLVGLQNLVGPNFSVHGVSQKEYWSGLPFPFPGDLPNPGIKSMFPAFSGRFLTTECLGKPEERITSIIFLYIISSPTPPTQFLSSCLLLLFIVIFWCTVLIPFSFLKLYIFSCFLNDCLVITINILIYKNLIQIQLSFIAYKNLASIWLHPSYVIITYYIFIHCVLINIHLLVIIVLHICLQILQKTEELETPNKLILSLYLSAWLSLQMFFISLSELEVLFSVRSFQPEDSFQHSNACSVTQLCQTLCDPMDCSPPGSSVHGTFQARILEWVAISSSKGSS